MADEDDQFHLGSGNWWDTSGNRFYGNGTTPQASIPATLNSTPTFRWPSYTAATASAAARSMVFHGGGANPNLQMMGLGNFQLESMAAAPSPEHWRQKVYSGGASSEEYSSVHDFKKMNNRGFSLDQPQSFSSQASSNDSTITSQNIINTGFQAADSAAAYGLLLPENQQQQHSNFQNRSINYPYSSSGGYGGASSTLNKYPSFLRTSPPAAAAHLHFTNNAPYWNASVPSAAITDHGRSSFFPPALQTQIPAAPSFDEKPKNTSSEGREFLATTKKNNTETSNKRPRIETPSSSPPPFKVRKEKMGDRITSLQQLVSPFGKTDTASVLSEAIECIKFLHGQLSVLSSPYMEISGAPMQHQHQNSDESKNDQEDPRQDLRSRGLCLVPISSTFPTTTHETTGDFWTPTFGGTFR